MLLFEQCTPAWRRLMPTPSLCPAYNADYISCLKIRQLACAASCAALRHDSLLQRPRNLYLCAVIRSSSSDTSSVLQFFTALAGTALPALCVAPSVDADVSIGAVMKRRVAFCCTTGSLLDICSRNLRAVKIYFCGSLCSCVRRRTLSNARGTGVRLVTMRLPRFWISNGFS